MAIDFGDPKSGFRHSEVITFINEEVLGNGGGPDFYLTFRSRSWNDIEDGLKSVVADSQVPRTIKRACAWSALALGVRMAAKQRERLARRIRRLQEQVDQREESTWALASELELLRQEREEVVSRLRNARDNLQQTLLEQKHLRQRLFHFDLSQQAVAGLQDERRQTEAWVQSRQKAASLATRVPSKTGIVRQPPPQPPPPILDPGYLVPFSTPFPISLACLSDPPS
ncbi:testis-expressed protein 13D-like [Perognathus longimembris pacificus]|uniref:testis-expressed protein 13D-like n=1 Tax=Perognathus longimembris pacificus TaxID=214514 RepID=UPI002018581C|nr:testis-expressed protein 13D-like [Perognathus longimembris pacificus]